MIDGHSSLRRGRIVRASRGDDARTTLTPTSSFAETDPHALPETDTSRAASTDYAIGAALGARRAAAHALASQLPDVVGLARLMAERLVGAALAESDQALLHFATRLLDEARGARRLELSCAPPDAPRLGRALHAQGLERDVVVNADAALPPNTLVLDTDLGRLEASLSGALDALEDAARR